MAAYAHVIILHFSSVFAIGILLLCTSCDLLQKNKTNVLSIGGDDHMFVVK